MAELKQQVASGKLVAPRVYISGTPINPASLKAFGASSPAEMARKQIQAGIDGVKVTGYTAAELKEITSVAHAAGKIVYGHTGPIVTKDAPGTVAAVENGLDGVEHVIQLLEDSLDRAIPLPAGFDGTKRDQLYRYFYGRVHQGVNSKKLDSVIATMVQRHVYLDPTIVNYERNFARRNTPELAADPALRYMPEERADRYGHYESADREGWKKVIGLMKQTTYKFHKAGGLLILGTDSQSSAPDGALPGWSMHEEMEVFVGAGISPMQTLQAATLNNATVMKVEKQLGTVEPGKLADLLILDADPLADIRNSRKIYRVIHAGDVLVPGELLEQNLKEFGERKPGAR